VLIVRDQRKKKKKNGMVLVPTRVLFMGSVVFLILLHGLGDAEESLAPLNTSLTAKDRTLVRQWESEKACDHTSSSARVPWKTTKTQNDEPTHKERERVSIAVFVGSICAFIFVSCSSCVFAMHLAHLGRFRQWNHRLSFTPKRGVLYSC